MTFLQISNNYRRWMSNRTYVIQILSQGVLDFSLFELAFQFAFAANRCLARSPLIIPELQGHTLRAFRDSYLKTDPECASFLPAHLSSALMYVRRRFEIETSKTRKDDYVTRNRRRSVLPAPRWENRWSCIEISNRLLKELIINIVAQAPRRNWRIPRRTVMNRTP